MIVFAWRGAADVIVVDQISAWLPVVKRLRPHARLVFYCHYPDLLLAPRGSALRRVYRRPFDWIERWGMGFADQVLVNSNFTAGKVADVLGVRNVCVLYPTVRPQRRSVARDPNLFVSLNRYERKKGHDLAIRALAAVGLPDARLLVAGGWDPAVRENCEHERELVALARALGVEDRVVFRKNISDDDKWEALNTARAVLYTPQNEHFGIVPLEAIAVGTIVIACNSGGPAETLSGTPCPLCEPTAVAFARAMHDIQAAADDPSIREQLQKRARDFDFAAFRDGLCRLLLAGD